MSQNRRYIAGVYSSMKNIGQKHLKYGNYPQNYDVYKAIDYMDKNNIWYIVWEEVCGFQKLQRIAQRPYLLYTLWDIGILQQNLLWVVWPRRMSTYGQRVIHMLFEHTHLYDVCTVSGGAEWVDTLTHVLSSQYAIPTIVVLAGGIWYYLTTWKHSLLLDVVARGGLIISEYQLWSTPKRYTFPQRNRIIAALSNVVFVPEASEQSGSLITVTAAHKLHIPIYAPLQSIFSESSKGSNNAIVTGKILPVLDMTFLDTHFTKKKWEQELSWVSHLFSSNTAVHKSIEEDLTDDMTRILFW